MNRDNEAMRRQITQLLTPAKNRGFYICPLCGSGTGPKSTGAMSIEKDEVHAKCFSCDFYGDIFDLVGKLHGLEAPEAYKKTIELVGAAPLEASRNHREIQGEAMTKPRETALEARAKPEGKDYSGYIETCRQSLQGSQDALQYLHGRGLTDESIERFMLGYDAKANAIVIPYSRDGRYFIRRTAKDPGSFYKPTRDEAGPEPLYNAAALYGGDAVFVVESQLCAISVVQAGGQAVAIGGTGAGKLVERLQDKPTQATLILSLDNDETGNERRDAIAEALKGAGAACFIANIAGEHKDPNEALQHDQDGLQQRIQAAIQSAREERDKEAAAEREAYAQTSAGAHIDEFLNGIKSSANTPAIPTGFDALDEVLDGGLYEGLYIIGAISSLGKTTLALQIADQIAQQGQDVLVFSLEMARSELMAKSISRITFEQCEGKPSNAKTTRGITSGQRYANYFPAELELINKAVEAYSTYAGHLFIDEGIGTIGPKEIAAKLEQHKRITGNVPVVLIDYLQIIAAADPRATDKQNTDRAVFELKRLSREYKTPVLAISSLNRENYTAKISMAAFKESGAIEYSSDVLIGLQFQAMHEDKKVDADKIDEYKKQPTRQIEARILKQRNGPTSQAIGFNYTAMFNHFQETGRVDE